MDKVLFVITTYNQMKFTEPLYNTLTTFKLSSPETTRNIEIDILIVDDASTDHTIDWCMANGINLIKKEEGKGLTHSWNEGYKYFRDNKEYKYVIISNNDVLVPKGAIKEMVEVFEKWPFSVVVPMSSVAGAGHNAQYQGVENVWTGTPSEWTNNPDKYQIIQREILEHKETIKKKNNLYQLDPVRMKMFNGFFFMMNRNIIKYERGDGNLFDPKFIMFKSEDEFNWSVLLPNNDFSAICKTAFVFHYKGTTVTKIKDYGKIANTEEYFKMRDK